MAQFTAPGRVGEADFEGEVVEALPQPCPNRHAPLKLRNFHLNP
jgi:hypothetical protein